MAFLHGIWNKSDPCYASEVNDTRAAERHILPKLLISQVYSQNMRNFGWWNVVGPMVLGAWLSFSIMLHISDWLVVYAGYSEGASKCIMWYARRSSKFLLVSNDMLGLDRTYEIIWLTRSISHYAKVLNINKYQWNARFRYDTVKRFA